jgi:hypothetical protein
MMHIPAGIRELAEFRRIGLQIPVSLSRPPDLEIL